MPYFLKFIIFSYCLLSNPVPFRPAHSTLYNITVRYKTANVNNLISSTIITLSSDRAQGDGKTRKEKWAATVWSQKYDTGG